jgi:DNA polymerase/3'-5' exonuclease PolX
MGISLREKISLLPLSQQKEIEERSAELIVEEKTRQQLRQLFKITQELNGQFLLLGINNVHPIKKYSIVGSFELVRASSANAESSLSHNWHPNL